MVGLGTKQIRKAIEALRRNLSKGLFICQAGMDLFIYNGKGVTLTEEELKILRDVYAVRNLQLILPVKQNLYLKVKNEKYFVHFK